MSEQLQQEFTQDDQLLLKRLLHRPLILPEEFKSWLYKFASGDAAPHFQEILGTAARAWRIADPVVGPDATSSTTFVSLGGPTLTGLPNGSYMVLFGGYSQSGTAPVRYISAFYNNQAGAPPNSPEADIYVEGQTVLFSIVALAADNANSIELRYRTNGGSCDFRNRWLHAVQVAS